MSLNEERSATAPKALRKRPGKLSTAAIQQLAEWAVQTASTPLGKTIVRKRLGLIDRTAQLSPGAELAFQDLLATLALKTTRKIRLPLNDQSFWARAANPLSDYRSSETLPAQADVVVIGAGLTGAAAAYHLKDSGLKVVVLEQGAPCAEASGRNGGNFELFPENSVGIYRGLAPGRMSYMQRCYPDTPVQVLDAVSERQASLVLGLALRNRNLLRQTILEERIACDFSPRGWLHIATDEQEEQALCDEVTLAAEQGQKIQIWSRKKIKDEFGIATKFLGRFIPGDGTYHPLKFVCGELQCAIRSGVALYANTKVDRIVEREAVCEIHTQRGILLAPTVIVATNAFTRELFPELKAIEPYQSQIQVTERVPDRVRGRIVTSDNGPVFFNQPRDGSSEDTAPLLMGGGDDRPMKNPYSRRRSPQVHDQLLDIRDSFFPELAGQPPSAEWIGPMAFTPDGLPSIGFHRRGIIVAAGYNGYGGTYATAAGYAAAQMAITGQTPDWVPREVFSPQRFMQAEPLFMSDKKGLWQVAASLCQQLASVNQRISDALTLQGIAPLSATRYTEPVAGPQGASSSAAAIEPRLLVETRAFKGFSLGEAKQLLAVMRQWHLPASSLICAEGSVGGTCFVVLSGRVDVSIASRGHQQLLATLEAGSLFGQVSVIDDVPRTATCTTSTDCVLLEIDREACQSILASGSKLAVKFLGALSAGLIEALHNSDVRLMELERQHFGQRVDAARPAA